MTTWFAKFRETSYKARRRTFQQRSGYNGVWQELLSDLRLPKAEEEDAEQLIQNRLNGLSIRHWDDDVKRM